MLFSIVGCGCALCYYRCLILRVTVCYRQSSFALVNDVVIRIRVCLQGIAECVRAASYNRLASGKGIGCSLSLCKAGFSFQSSLAIYKCLAIILLAQVRTL